MELGFLWLVFALDRSRAANAAICDSGANSNTTLNIQSLQFEGWDLLNNGITYLSNRIFKSIYNTRQKSKSINSMNL